MSLQTPAQSELSFTQKRPLGGGGCLTPDGRAIVYVAPDRALHVMDISSRRDRLLVSMANGSMTTS
ncbi:MAG TPA: hypothetical protein VHZ73_10820 [Vicinamibacterales bacterium]|nr:hypothetical protein [Vicinamibacterales bacterium]